jgi:hypothetical protein
MDGEDLKIFNSLIERDSSINEDLDKVGFLGRFLTRFLTGQGLVLTNWGFLTTGLDITDLRKLELVPTLFGFLTTRFLAGLDKMFFWVYFSECHGLRYFGILCVMA